MLRRHDGNEMSGAAPGEARAPPGVFFASEEDTMARKASTARSTNARPSGDDVPRGAPGPPRAFTPSTRVLRSLGIVGWDHLEPVVIAALATEAPLLVIGPHGSAKTLLLGRIAAALGLVHRHYNASLLNFDDLVGFPVPDGGRLVYLETPSTIWQAESVFFDEVSRCRPDLQNKLFPIVHDRVVQGVALERLRYRWAAMNPPPAQDGGASSGEPEYAGTEPLDVALADRFALIVPAPGLDDLGTADQLAVLRDRGRVHDGASAGLAAVVAATRERLDAAREELGDAVPQYVQLVAQRLAAAGHPLSTRRAVQLAQNIVALRAAALATGAGKGPEDAFYAAACYSLPDAAWGRRPEPGKVIAAHRTAWEVAHLATGSPLRRVLCETDPLRRIAFSLWGPLAALDAGQVIADSWSGLPRVARLAAALVFMPRVCRRADLPAATVESIARDYALVVRRGNEQLTLSRGGQDWKRTILGQQLATLDRKTRRGRELTNAAIQLMAEEHQFAFDDLVESYDRAARAAEHAAQEGPTGRAPAAPEGL
jgi:MoxR-like ATPase